MSPGFLCPFQEIGLDELHEINDWITVGGFKQRLILLELKFNGLDTGIIVATYCSYD